MSKPVIAVTSHGWISPASCQLRVYAMQGWMTSVLKPAATFASACWSSSRNVNLSGFDLPYGPLTYRSQKP